MDTLTGVRPSGLADLSPIALLHIDQRRRIGNVNPAAEDLFKLSRRALVGRPLSEVVYHDSLLFELIDRADRDPAEIAAPATPIAGPSMQAGLICDIRLRTVEGGNFILALSETPVRDSGEGIAGAAGFGRILGHEVKNPLAGIIGAAQLLERQAQAGQSELLDIIKDEARRIERLVNRLSAFELFSAPRMQACNVHALLDKVVASERAAMGTRVEFRREYDPSLPDMMGDPDHLQQAFQNIVRNAAEAASEGGRKGEVVIRTAYAAGLAMRQARLGSGLRRAMLISFEDNGQGIPRERQATIFDVFQSTKSGGRGLGLSVVSEVVNAHGGQIRVDSQPGATRFTVLLPLSEA
ncbi:PAS domain-containing sensor histidine kinase [Hyphomonas sp. WL0036]|uniref:two-component system sensor histidine kinase NtrB n=1 Tax=Hyphomonas sediminis TaxID=2866160 RepID=UPI001C7F8A63|nr:PAS domain-containing sensor histidine kinase [Hyphomonas sediminis]